MTEEKHNMAAPRGRQPWQFRLAFRLLERLRYGRLTAVLPDGSRQLFVGPGEGPESVVYFRDKAAMTRVLTRGELGFAEGYIAGDWDTDALGDLLYLLHLNETYLIPSAPGLQTVAALWGRLRHRIHRNSRRGARRNIAYHYDLGNDFYQLWLDETWTYSAAVFDHPQEDLAAAQRRKYDLLLARLELDSGHHLLEIGCGWGGFARHAARTTGARVTGITLSREQLDFARAQVKAEGLQDRVSFRLQDYRDVGERFDRVASIEMYEAVGEAYWGQYFNTIRRVLAPDGRAALQGITIDPLSFAQYRRSVDFIQAYIFPGGMLASPQEFQAQALAGGLQSHDPAFFGAHYAETLRRWHASAVTATAQICSRFDDRFLRMWRYYLAYCEAGFRSGNIDLMQVTLSPREA